METSSLSKRGRLERSGTMPRERVTGQLAIVVSKFTVKFKVLRDTPLACIDPDMISSRKLEFNFSFFSSSFLLLSLPDERSSILFKSRRIQDISYVKGRRFFFFFQLQF